MFIVSMVPPSIEVEPEIQRNVNTFFIMWDKFHNSETFSSQYLGISLQNFQKLNWCSVSFIIKICVKEGLKRSLALPYFTIFILMYCTKNITMIICFNSSDLKRFTYKHFQRVNCTDIHYSNIYSLPCMLKLYAKSENKRFNLEIFTCFKHLCF